MKREYCADSLSGFLETDPERILGILVSNSDFDLETSQRDAWLEEIAILKASLEEHSDHGSVYFEYSIPRLGRRIDVVAVIKNVIFVVEFKIGAREFASHAVDQVWDYALDLKNFHTSSHNCSIAPVLVATGARNYCSGVTMPRDGLFPPVLTNGDLLANTILDILNRSDGPTIDANEWERGRYCPTPTIIEAATALYNGHAVSEISRSDASAINLSQTSDTISEVIRVSRAESRKSICFVTGVPGAGKTLVGLNVATTHTDKSGDLHSVFLSGNGPLVSILREALARDKVVRARNQGRKVKKGEALSEVKMFIQNVHHFRDDCLIDRSRPPIEHVALFDEAQRAWNREQTSSFMRRKKKEPGFDQSEPEFLISCLDRHPDWAVVVCLVGGGQEINTGEAGISEWMNSLIQRFPSWDIYVSARLTDSEYAAGGALESLTGRPNVTYKEQLHLSVSMRSFRSEHVSLLVKELLDLRLREASSALERIGDSYPIVVTREVKIAKDWLRDRARGSERYGIVVSSEAQRLKPHAIDVRAPIDPIHWFLDGRDDVRSSYYLEDVATEFQVQGLELDWTCVTWDADFRHNGSAWEHWSFCGDRWNKIRKHERQIFLKNAYRVLLTRARQGMVIVVPHGDSTDPTRNPMFYDLTFDYLRQIGFKTL